MRIKTAEKIMWGMTALFALLRVLQYIFVIGEDGFFVKNSLWQSLLSDSLYYLMAIFALLSLVLRLSKVNRYKTNGAIACTPLTAVLSLVNAVILAVYAVLLLIRMDWMGAVVLAAAVYFVLLYFYACGRGVAVMHYMALFALAYPCVRVIRMFFDNFKEIKVSENIIDMVAMCAMIIALIALTKLCMGFEESMTKLGWSLWLFAGFGVLAGIGKLFGLIWTHAVDAVSVAAAVSDLAMWVLVLVVYHSCTRFVPAPEEPAEDEKTAETVAD